MIIRKFCSTDLLAVYQVFYQTVHSINRKDYSQEQCAAWAPENPDIQKWIRSLEKNKSFVAEENGLIVGFADLAGDGCINRLYVHKDFQKRGIGTALIQTLEAIARSLGSKELRLEASITAKSFFEKQGYVCLKSQNKQHGGQQFLNYCMIKKLLI